MLLVDAQVLVDRSVVVEHLNLHAVIGGVDAHGGKNNPYTVDHKNHPGLFNASGHIGLLGHGAGIKFRNIRIKELPAAKTKK